jgi:hypothetical protein
LAGPRPATGFTWKDFQCCTVRETLDYANTLIVADHPIYVLDPELNLIAATPLEDPHQIGEPFKARETFSFQHGVDSGCRAHRR